MQKDDLKSSGEHFEAKITQTLNSEQFGFLFRLNEKKKQIIGIKSQQKQPQSMNSNNK
jgi:hypothetical protein